MNLLNNKSLAGKVVWARKDSKTFIQEVEVMGEILEAQEKGIRSAVNALEIFSGGVYVCGHPQINETVSVAIAATDDSFVFFQYTTQLGSIPKKAVKKISIEDKTTAERRVTVVRVLALGIFAFAFKKKQTNEAGFLVIDWDGEKGMENNTILKFEGKGAMTEANTLRNSLVKLL